MDDLVTWLREQLDKEWLLATEASRHDEDPLPPAGAHWQWVCDEHDEVVEPNPGAGEFMECSQGGWDVSLRSVEQYPYRSMPGFQGPTFVIRGSDEVSPVHGSHIVRWDPARVLAEVEAKRARIDLLADVLRAAAQDRTLDPELAAIGAMAEDLIKLEAQPYASRPGFRDEWRLT